MLVDATSIGLRHRTTSGHDRADRARRGRHDGDFACAARPTDHGALHPLPPGQRVIPRELILRVPGLETAHYAIELAVTRQVQLEGLRVKYVPHHGLSQVMRRRSAA
jgi:hypothetical protein